MINLPKDKYAATDHPKKPADIQHARGRGYSEKPAPICVNKIRIMKLRNVVQIRRPQAEQPPIGFERTAEIG
jgi:hypothetical protein